MLPMRENFKRYFKPFFNKETAHSAQKKIYEAEGAKTGISIINQWK
jgi:hypothetical protein